MTNKEKLIEKIEDIINDIELMIYNYEVETEETQQDLYELFEQKEMLEFELDNLLESVENEF